MTSKYEYLGCPTKDEWDKVQKRLALLDALEAGGVDNWEGYHESTRHLYGDEDDE